MLYRLDKAACPCVCFAKYRNQDNNKHSAECHSHFVAYCMFLFSTCWISISFPTFCLHIAILFTHSWICHETVSEITKRNRNLDSFLNFSLIYSKIVRSRFVMIYSNLIKREIICKGISISYSRVRSPRITRDVIVFIFSQKIIKILQFHH